MIITDKSTTSRLRYKESSSSQKGDILNMEKFNSLPSPVTAVLCGGGGYWIETLCVQTGLMRLDVSGKVDHRHFSEVMKLVDIDGGKHNPDDFWLDA